MILIGLDGQSVIVFGGLGITDDNLPPEDALYVLNLADLTWSIPKTSGQLPVARRRHGATVIGKYMVITFGK